MKRQYKITSHPSTLGRSITFSESDLPNMMEISIHDSCTDTTQRINISRKDWEAVHEMTRQYCSSFAWAPESVQLPLQPLQPLEECEDDLK